jgi:transposase
MLVLTGPMTSMTRLLIDEQGHQVGMIRVNHTPAGLATLATFLQHIIATAPKEQMACIIETTHGLLIAHLLEAGWPVYPVNPRTVDRKRSAARAKTDRIDAYLLAKTGRADLADLHRLIPDNEKIAELKLLTRDQDALVQMQTRLESRLTACLKAYYPVALELFGKLQQKSTLLFLQTYPTPAAAAAASPSQIQQVLRQAKHPHAAKVASQIAEQVRQPQLQADAATIRAKSRLLQALVSQLLPLIEQIAHYDKEINTLFLTHEDHELFESLPRAGQRLAPRLLAEIGDDRTRYQAATSLQALGGTSPVLYQSGMYSKAHRRVGCVKPLRNALYQFARPTTQCEAWAND